MASTELKLPAEYATHSDVKNPSTAASTPVVEVTRRSLSALRRDFPRGWVSLYTMVRDFSVFP